MRSASCAGHVPFATRSIRPSLCQRGSQLENRKDDASKSLPPASRSDRLQKELTFARRPRTFSGKRGTDPETNMRRILLLMVAATLGSAAEEPAKGGKALIKGTDLAGWKLRD